MPGSSKLSFRPFNQKHAEFCDRLEVFDGFKGVSFVDVESLTSHPSFYRLCDDIASRMQKWGIDTIGAMDSRGYLVATCVASKMGISTKLLRKPGRVPGDDVIAKKSQSEYDTTEFACRADSFKGCFVALVDDLCATGQSAKIGKELVEAAGGTVVGFFSLVELTALNGRKVLKDAGIKHVGTCFYADDTSDPPKEIFDRYHGPSVSEWCELESAVQRYESRAVVLCHPSMNHIADSIDPEWGWAVRVPIDFGTFRDRSSNIKFPSESVLRNRDVVFLLNTLDKEQLDAQMWLISVLPRLGIKKLQVIVTFLAEGTNERVTESGILATAETMMRKMTQTYGSCSENVTFHIIEPHALSTQFYGCDAANVKFETMVSQLMQLVTFVPLSLRGKDNVGNMYAYDAIVYPDKGAQSRFGSMPELKHLPSFVYAKSRDGEDRHLSLEGARNMVPGRPLLRVLFIDDLVQSGSTSLTAARMFKSAHPDTEIHFYVTHAVFPEQSWRAFLHPECPISHVITTDTISHPVLFRRPDKFTILSCATKINAILWGKSDHSGALQATRLGSPRRKIAVTCNSAITDNSIAAVAYRYPEANVYLRKYRPCSPENHSEGFFMLCSMTCALQKVGAKAVCITGISLEYEDPAAASFVRNIEKRVPFVVEGFQRFATLGEYFHDVHHLPDTNGEWYRIITGNSQVVQYGHLLKSIESK